MATVTSFQSEYLDQAACLLAGRHRVHRCTQPELPARFENPEDARRAVEAAWQRPCTSGTAAFDGSRLIGYLIGDETTDTLRGHTANVRLAGHALAADAPADLYLDLYAAAGERWVTRGCFDHYVMAPAADTALAWFAIGFGQEQVYALRPLNSADDSPPTIPNGLTIRRATSEDRGLLADVAPWIAAYQAQAPVWAPAPPDMIAEIRMGYADLADDATATVWLALEAGECVGFQLYYAAQAAPAELLIPERCVELSVAATHPDRRGKGINRLLTAIGLADALHHEYTCCITDYRATNPLSSRFWPRTGFCPAVYRLARHIDSRVLWATGKD